jgi:PmbA protein
LSDYTGLAQQIIKTAIDRGADGAECNISEGNQFSVSVRMREIESLTEAGSRAAGLRVLIGKRAGSAYTSDLSKDGLDQMIDSALAVAALTSEDPYAGLPEASELGQSNARDLGMYSPSVENLEAGVKIDHAKMAEAAALEFDPRIDNSEGSSFQTHLGLTVFANSLGFVGSYRTSSCSLSVVPVAKEGGSMERDFWYSIARSYDKLEKPQDVGRRAAERALRRLGARKVPTQKAPIIFEPRAARTLLDNIFDAISGDAIYRNESFLTGKLGETIANSRVTVIDDGTMPGLFGTSPFDDEGAPSRRTVVIEKGALQNYLLNTYTGRKLGMKTTGNASRGLTGNAGIGHGNFYLGPGDTSPADIIRTVRSGFYVTELIGFGVNIVTGDYSRGAAGIWIENGELAYPVSEVTIAGTLQEMLHGIEAIGSDLDFRGSIASPTLLIREMTVSGQ